MRVKKISNKKTGNVLNINKLSFQLFCLWQGRRGRGDNESFLPKSDYWELILMNSPMQLLWKTGSGSVWT